MERIARGWRLVGLSWELLKQDKELIWLPVLSALSIGVAAIPLGLGMYSFGVFEAGRTEVSHYLALFAFYLVSYFIAIFFNAALIGAAAMRMDGGNPTIGDGLRIALSKIEKIFLWSVIAATVGLILRSIQERAGLLGKIVAMIASVAWSAITFFVVPVLIFESGTVTGSIGRSKDIFRARWGESFTGNGAIGIISMLIMIPIIVVGIALTSVAPVLGVMVLVAAVAVVGSASAALTGVFNTALYRYAVGLPLPAGFTEADLRATFHPRKERRKLFG